MPAMSLPRISMRPDCGVRMPQSRPRNVDLPLPDGPISSRRSRAGKTKRWMASEKALRPGQAKRRSDTHTTCDLAAAGSTLIATMRQPAAYIMPARSMRGLARVTSNLVCPFGVITLTSSFWAPAKAWK